MEKNKNGKENIYFIKEENIPLYNAIENTEYKILKTLKNDHRSSVFYIEIDNANLLEYEKRVVLKIPKEKNKRAWQRFLSIFIGSESKREFIRCENILKNNFLGALPIIAVEKRCGIIVKDSYFVSSYINGESNGYENIVLALNELYKVHKAGYLHGDAQLSNFIILGEHVYLIDCKFKRNKMGIISKINEFIYFEKSCYKNIETPYKSSALYKILKVIDIYKDKFNYFFKRVRGKKK